MSTGESSHDNSAAAADISGIEEDYTHFSMSDMDSDNPLEVGYLIQRLTEASEEIKKKNKEITKLKVDYESTKNHAADVHRRMEEDYNRLKKEVERSHEQLKDDTQAIKEKEKEYIKLQKSYESSQEDLASYSEQISDLKEKLAMEQENVRNLRSEVRNLECQRSDLEKEVEAAGEQRASDKAEKETLRAQLKSCNKDLKETRKHKKELEVTMHETVNEFEKRLAEANGSEDNYKKRWELSHAQLKEMTSQLQSLKDAYQEREERLSKSFHSPEQVQQWPEALDTPNDPGSDYDSRPPSRCGELSQSMTLAQEIGDESAEAYGYDFVQGQGNFDPEMDCRSDGDSNANSSLDQSISSTSDSGLDKVEFDSLNSDSHPQVRAMTDGNMSSSGEWSTGSSDDEVDTMDKPDSHVISLGNDNACAIEVRCDALASKEEAESDVPYDKDAYSHNSRIYQITANCDSEKSPLVDQPRQPYGIPTTSKQLWTNERFVTSLQDIHAAQYRSPFDQCVCQKREMYEQGTQTENNADIPEQGYQQDPHEWLILGTPLCPQTYLVYMLTILLAGIIGSLIRLETSLRKHYKLPTGIQYVKTRGQIDGDTRHPSEPTMSVWKAEAYRKYIVRFVLFWICILGGILIELVYVWWSDDEWQWTTANRLPRCFLLNCSQATGFRYISDGEIFDADRVALIALSRKCI